MDIATVIGTVVASQKVEALIGYKLLLVADVEDATDDQAPVVALDLVGAGERETVLIVRGSSARAAANLSDTPVDAVIVGIVDQIDRDGKTVYQKHSTPTKAGTL